MKALCRFSLVLLGILVFLSGCTNPSTPAGHEGYVKENPRIWGKGGFRGAMKGPANFGVSIWRNDVENVDFRPQTYAETFNILAKDELNISFRFQTIIKVKPGTIRSVVEEYAGAQFYPRYIKEPLRAMVRKNVQTLESRQVKEKRTEIARAVMGELTDYLADTPFVAVSGVVGNIDYPKVVTEAVEKKLAAKQLLDEKETQREIAKKDAEIRIEEARGIAEAQRIINSTLTVNYLQHEAINAQLKMAASPNHTTVYIPSGANGIPLVGTLNQQQGK
jgi:hypothetical protein